MQHRLAHLVEHRPIELDLATLDLEIDLLAEGLRCVPNNARKSLEDLPHRHHPAGHDLVLEIGEYLRGAHHGFRQLAVAEPLRDLCDAVTGDHQLTDDVHQGVQSLCLDPDVARSFLRRYGGRRRLGGIGVLPVDDRKLGGERL